MTLQDFYDECASRVRRARTSRGMDVGMVSILSGVESAEIERIESGCGVYSHLFMSRIARALEVPVEQIFPTVIS